MLPPTIITAPTSAAARPKPASRVVISEKRASHSKVATRRAAADIHGRQLVPVFGPQVLDDLTRQRGDDRRDQDRLGDDHRLRREQNTKLAQRTRARQQQEDHEPDHDRRQPHAPLTSTISSVAPGKARQRKQRAERHADEWRPEASPRG